MANFLKKSWYYLLMACMLVAIYLLYKKAHQPQPKGDNSSAIEQLHQTVDSLAEVNSDLQIAYDNKQTTVINNITYKNTQDAKTITNLPNYSSYQHDSLWAVLFASQDSIPRGYWDILKQKTGGRSPKELAIQGDLQE